MEGILIAVVVVGGIAFGALVSGWTCWHLGRKRGVEDAVVVVDYCDEGSSLKEIQQRLIRHRDGVYPI